MGVFRQRVRQFRRSLGSSFPVIDLGSIGNESHRTVSTVPTVLAPVHQESPPQMPSRYFEDGRQACGSPAVQERAWNPSLRRYAVSAKGSAALVWFPAFWPLARAPPARSARAALRRRKGDPSYCNSMHKGGVQVSKSLARATTSSSFSSNC